MSTQKALPWLPLLVGILMSLSQSYAKQSSPTSQILNITAQWNLHPFQSFQEKLKLSPSMVLAGALCFLAASISSAGGIGGGGLFIPILTIVSGLDLKTASSFSAFMVTGGSVANVICNLFGRSAKFGGRTLIDFDIALLSEPCMLLGVSIGVICNLVFPEWLITVLFAVFLAWSSIKTCKNGLMHWWLESEEVNGSDCGTSLENGLVRDGNVCTGEEVNVNEELLLCKEADRQVLRFPWKKLGLLVMIWFSFCFLYLIRGNRYGEGIIPLEPCGILYWILSFLQVPLAVAFTPWSLMRSQPQTTNKQMSTKEVAETAGSTTSDCCIFPLMALLAGVLGGVFGIGGGMLISPLLLHVGVPPEITAATCSFMVFFSSTMSAFQYLLLGMDHVDTALALSVTCFIASLLGLLVVQKAIQGYGRPSLIVFSVSVVMILSTILMTSFGAVDVWRDYMSGKYMGFKLPC